MSKAYVALLRGVNVGGKNKLPMVHLCEMFSAAGCSSVKSYIQSGNVVFRAAPGAAGKIATLIAEQIVKAYGYRTPVVLRTADELASVAANNPFLAAGGSEEALHVMFLADLPSPQAVQSLDPHRAPPDEFMVRGRDVYLRLPNGAGRSKLTNQYFDSKLKTVGTMRNWRTVNKLLELMEARK
jgi:uncharacterized protein (DUF1697 family)